MNEKLQTIVIPVHPDERDWPISLVHIPLSRGRFATIQGPLAPKTMTALGATIEACRECLIEKPSTIAPENPS